MLSDGHGSWVRPWGQGLDHLALELVVERHEHGHGVLSQDGVAIGLCLGGKGLGEAHLTLDFEKVHGLVPGRTRAKEW
jgi:hypothetical protein